MTSSINAMDTPYRDDLAKIVTFLPALRTKCDVYKKYKQSIKGDTSNLESHEESLNKLEQHINTFRNSNTTIKGNTSLNTALIQYLTENCTNMIALYRDYYNTILYKMGDKEIEKTCENAQIDMKEIIDLANFITGFAKKYLPTLKVNLRSLCCTPHPGYSSVGDPTSSTAPIDFTKHYRMVMTNTGKFFSLERHAETDRITLILWE